MIIFYSFILGLILLSLVYLLQDLKKLKRNIKIFKRVVRVVMYRIKRSMNSSRNKRRASKMDEETKNEKGNLKIFEFVRIRCARKDFKLNPNPNQESNFQQGQDDEDEHQNEEQNKYTFGVPSKRSGHRAVCNEENLYIWGGYCPKDEQDHLTRDDENDEDEILSPLFPELWKFNLTSKKWHLLKTTGEIPDKTVASHGACLYGNSTLIVFGGTGYPFGENLHNNLFICNLNTLEWKKHDLKGEKPVPLYGSSLILVENDLYVLFGTNARIYCSNVYKINLKTLQSTKLFDSISLNESVQNFTQLSELNAKYPNDFLGGRYRQEVIFFKNKFYTFGGGNIEGDAFALDQLPVFNLETKDWEFINTHPDSRSNEYPQKRKFHSCFLINNNVYVFGGMYCNLETSTFIGVDNTIWRLDLESLRWEDLKIEMPVLTYFHASCINKSGQIFFHGGVKTVRAGEPMRINHLYTILIKIPKLADISWTKLIATHPNIMGLSKTKLFEMGVPENYIKRIS